MDSCHLPDLCDQRAFDPVVERQKALRVENAALVVQTGPLPVVLAGKGVGTGSAHPGDEGDIAFIISLRGDERILYRIRRRTFKP